MVRMLKEIDLKIELPPYSTEANIATLLMKMEEYGMIDITKLGDILLTIDAKVPEVFRCEGKGKMSYKEPVDILENKCIILVGCGLNRARKVAEMAEKKYEKPYVYAKIFLATKKDYIICRESLLNTVKEMEKSSEKEQK
jgi:hypothetical protein